MPGARRGGRHADPTHAAIDDARDAIDDGAQTRRHRV